MAWFSQKIIIIPSAVLAGVGFTSIFKDSRSGPAFDSERKIKADGKTIIVTGANSGIGREAARELAKRGAKVYMACRDMEKCENVRNEIVLESRNRYVYCRPCDLASFQSIKEFVKIFKEEQDDLHVLINNAGVMMCPKSVTKEGIETQLGVNHMGHFLLTNLLLDYLKKSAPSRIINISDIAHAKGKIHKEDLNLDKDYNAEEAYRQSKLANILFSTELGIKLLDSKVTVNTVYPGIVDTDLNRHLPVRQSFSYYFWYPMAWPWLRLPRQGVQTVIYAALEPKLEKVTGEYFVDSQKSQVAPVADDFETAKWLWAVSEKWTRLKDSTATVN